MQLVQNHTLMGKNNVIIKIATTIIVVTDSGNFNFILADFYTDLNQ